MTWIMTDKHIISLDDLYHIKYLPARTDIDWKGTLRFHYHSGKEIFFEGSEAKEIWDSMDNYIKDDLS